MNRRLHRDRDERGAGTIMVATVALVLVGVSVVCLWIAGWIGSAQHARSVADLSANAAAQATAVGDDACPVARRVAELNRGRLVSCRASGDTITFQVSVEVAVPLRPHIPGASREITGEATAGSVA